MKLNFAQRISLGVNFSLCFLVGCAQESGDKKIQVACDTSVSIFDSFKAILLEYDDTNNTATEILSIEPDKSVIGQAYFDCTSGKYIYNTEERMTTGAKGTLHIRSKSAEKMIDFKDGINSFYPLPDRGILIRTKLIKRGPVDPEMGDMSPEETQRNLPKFDLKAPFRIQDVPPSGQIYLDEILFDLDQLAPIKTVKGTIFPHRIQDAKYITYSLDKSVYEFDPETGFRKRIHDFSDQKGDGIGLANSPEMQAGTMYYSYKNVLYAVNGENAKIDVTQKYYDANSIFQYDDQLRKWAKLSSFQFKGSAILMRDDNIVVIGNDRVAVYNIGEMQLHTVSLRFSGYEPISAGSIKNGWAVLMSKAIANATPEHQLWFFSQNWSEVLLTQNLVGFNRPKISTHQTPISSR